MMILFEFYSIQHNVRLWAFIKREWINYIVNKRDWLIKTYSILGTLLQYMNVWEIAYLKI